MSKAPQIRTIFKGEVRNVAVDVSGKLDSGEKLTGTPTTSEATSTLSISGETVNTVALTVDGDSVPIGEAIQFIVDASSAVSGRTYIVDMTCGTTANQTVKGTVTLRCQ
jgi:hypothetical protein